MRIALFTETYLPVINGVVTHVKTLKEGLEGLGHKVIIVTADAKVRKHEITGDVLYCPAIKLKKIYNYDIASPISSDRLKILKTFNPDIIHIHNEFGIGLSGLFIARALKIPLVYTLHTMYDDYIYYVANKHLCNFVTRATHKYAKTLANAAGAIIGPSKKVDEYFKKCGVKKQINVIPNSAELDLFNPKNIEPEYRSKIRKEFGFGGDDFVLSFCGRLGKEKNISLLLEYISATVKPDDKIKFLIIGDGPYFELHLNETKKYNLLNIVKFAGKVLHENLPRYYVACDAYVTASLTEVHSISTLEAMAMKLPVVHINDDMNRGQVIEGVNGFIYNNAGEMYEIMKKLKTMPNDELASLKENVRFSVEKAGSDALAESILEIYRSVIIENTKKKSRASRLRKF